MRKADRLSRRPDQKVGTKNNNSNQTLIKDYQIHNLVKVVIKELEVNIVEKIKKTRSKDKEVVRVVEEIKKIGVKVQREKKQQIEGDLVLKEEKMYVPKNKKLKVEIIQLHYDIPVTKYGGKQKMVELVIRNYWWPEVTRDIE